jgi:hypothetical protein
MPLAIRGGADNFDQEGNKLQWPNSGYSTYSPWSSINFLARCSNFCKPLKNIQVMRQQWPPCRTKNGDISIFFFSVQGKGGSPIGVQRIAWVIKTLKSQVGPFLLGFKCPVSRSIVVQEHPLGKLSAARYFFSKCPSNAPAKMSNTRVDNLALWKVIN